MENFRSPNFELVADCLEFLVTRYDETATVEGDISTESDRVRFLRNVDETFAKKAGARLNLKRLYSADGVAVKELLKTADVLRRALEEAAEEDDEDEATGTKDEDSGGFGFSADAYDAEATRRLASDIVNLGAATHDCLRLEEEELRDARVRSVRGTVDIHSMEGQIREQIDAVKMNVLHLERGLVDLAKDEKTLTGVLEKRKLELERAEKRLGSLKAARPAYADERDALRTEVLPDLYGAYLERHRNLTFLEAALDRRYAEEESNAAKRNSALREMREKLREEEMRVLRGEDAVGDDEFEDEFEDEAFGGAGDGAIVGRKKASFRELTSSKSRSAVPASAGARVPKRFGIGGGVVGGTTYGARATAPASAKRRVVGSMMGGDASDSDDGIRDDGDQGTSSDENDF